MFPDFFEDIISSLPSEASLGWILLLLIINILLWIKMIENGFLILLWLVFGVAGNSEGELSVPLHLHLNLPSSRFPATATMPFP